MKDKKYFFLGTSSSVWLRLTAWPSWKYAFAVGEVVLRIKLVLKKLLVQLPKNKEGFNLQNTRRDIETKNKLAIF